MRLLKNLAASECIALPVIIDYVLGTSAAHVAVIVFYTKKYNVKWG